MLLEEELKKLNFPTNYNLQDFQIYEKVWIIQDGLIYPALIVRITDRIQVLKYAIGLWVSVFITPELVEKREYDLSELIYFDRQHFIKNIWNEKNNEI